MKWGRKKRQGNKSDSNTEPKGWRHISLFLPRSRARCWRIRSIGSTVNPKLLFSQPLPLFQSHQPTLQPARQQKASRRLLVQRPRNEKSPERDVWNLRKTSIFSKPFPLFQSHQPTLQPARRQNASRRLLQQTPRNGKSPKRIQTCLLESLKNQHFPNFVPKRDVWNLSKTSTFPTLSTFSIPSAHLATSQAAERKSKATCTNPSKREKSQPWLLTF